MNGAAGIRIKVGGITWQVSAPSSPHLERLARAVNDPCEKAAKASRVRKIYFLPPGGDGPPLILKEYRSRGIRAMIRHLFLGSPARREWRALLRLRAAGVSVPETVALGRRGWWSIRCNTYLATSAVVDAFTLEELLLKKRALPISRKILAESVAGLVRGMHDAGVLHQDLHAANILVDSGGRTFVLDLHGCRIARRLSMAQRLRDLVSLSGAFLIHGSRTDRLRFFKAYADGLDTTREFDQTARILEKSARRRLHDFLRKFDLRPLRSGKHFRTVRIHELKGICEPTERAMDLCRLLGAYPREALDEHGRLIHATPGTRVYVVRGADGPLVVKLYTRPGIFNGMKRLFKGSKARQSWVNYHRLLYRGLKVPKPVLFLEEPFFAPLGRSCVVTEEAAGFVHLDRFIKDTGRSGLEAILDPLARDIARIHRLFLSNRDLKAQNILVSPAPEILFIDPEGVQPMEEPAPYIMARDLMRLNASFQPGGLVTTTDRLRFLKAYLAHLHPISPSIKGLWLEIYHLSLEKWAAWAKKRFTG